MTDEVGHARAASVQRPLAIVNATNGVVTVKLKSAVGWERGCWRRVVAQSVCVGECIARCWLSDGYACEQDQAPASRWRHRGFVRVLSPRGTQHDTYVGVVPPLTTLPLPAVLQSPHRVCLPKLTFGKLYAWGGRATPPARADGGSGGQPHRPHSHDVCSPSTDICDADVEVVVQGMPVQRVSKAVASACATVE